MKVAFCDYSNIEYSPDEVATRALGGTQSAVSYLASQLVRDGLDVTLVNAIKKPGIYAGIKCPGLITEFSSFDAVVIVNGAIGKEMRPHIKGKMFLWNGHDTNQPAIEALKDPEEVGSWDGFIFVSNWQAACFEKFYGIARKKICVIRNAVSPYFENIERVPGTLNAPRFVYTSTPFRGLDVLLLAYPTIHKAFPDSSLKIFSGMDIYSQTHDNYTTLYELAKVLPGVSYSGPISQKELARELAHADILSYPNTFAETSCIAVMEAMAAGLLVYTSKYGALPETLSGFGLMMDFPADRMLHAKLFADVTIHATKAAALIPDVIDQRIRAEQEYIRTHATWKVRAGEWQRMFEAWT